jgi:hypothetical protein
MDYDKISDTVEGRSSFLWDKIIVDIRFIISAYYKRLHYMVATLLLGQITRKGDRA